MYTASFGSAAHSVALTALLACVLLGCSQVHAIRKNNMLDSKGLAYYYDEIHPDGNTGHRCTPAPDGPSYADMCCPAATCLQAADARLAVATLWTLHLPARNHTAVLHELRRICLLYRRRVMAELVVTLLQRGVADLLHSPLTEADKSAAVQPLPPPMIAGNWESLSDR
jgi:hypothetical protein